MIDFVGRARSFVGTNYREAIAAFLGGSAASGDATKSSDLDILVVLPDEWSSTSFVETTTYEGQFVEAFVYGRTALESWLERGRNDARPVLDRLIAQGLSLVEGEVSEGLASSSRRALDVGPSPIDPEQLRLRRYSLSALVDDVEDASDIGIRRVAMATAWQEAAELALLSMNCWIGRGKWLLRELRANGDPFGLAAWADGGAADAAALVDSCNAVLESVGGYLQAGLIRGMKPSDL